MRKRGSSSWTKKLIDQLNLAHVAVEKKRKIRN